ncbi:MAG: hypothetical protein WKG07_27845 [Hymenobacter sp.]
MFCCPRHHAPASGPGKKHFRKADFLYVVQRSRAGGQQLPANSWWCQASGPMPTAACIIAGRRARWRPPWGPLPFRALHIFRPSLLCCWASAPTRA